MLVLVTYDVNIQDQSGAKRLRKVAKICESFGQRVQNSVFECNVDYSQYITLKYKLNDVINEEKDSIRYYNLGNNYNERIEHIGAKESYDSEGVLII